MMLALSRKFHLSSVAYLVDMACGGGWAIALALLFPPFFFLGNGMEVQGGDRQHHCCGADTMVGPFSWI